MVAVTRFSKDENAGSALSGEKSSMYSGISCTALFTSKRLLRRDTNPVASSIRAWSLLLGLGKSSRVPIAGKSMCTVPFGFPAASLMALVSKSNHASVIRTGTTPMERGSAVVVPALAMALLISVNLSPKDAVSSSR